MIEVAAGEAIKVFASKLMSADWGWVGTPAAEEEVLAQLSLHIDQVINWSSSTHLFGLGRGLSIEDDTVPLQMSDLPRRFRAADYSGNIFEEVELLERASSILVLGDPGAGKTTTLKRIAHRLMFGVPLSEADSWRMPVMLIFREHQWQESFFSVLLSNLGIDPLRSRVDQTTSESTIDLRDEPASVSVARGYTARADELKVALAEALNAVHAVVLLDGLDEMPPEYRARVENEIVQLQRLLTTSKVIVSCRSGDHSRPMDGFDVLELCPLSISQLDVVTEGILGARSTEFVETLKNSPLAEIGNRPLFLTNLALIFLHSGGNLPSQPSSVYDRTIDLVIKSWDEQRQVSRHSLYANFISEEKRDFLADLAYFLTVKLQSRRFSHDDLVEGYKSIAPRFGLPDGDADLVAGEIEAHTGLIVSSGHAFYEFSHLTLQEYLCAYHLVRNPFAEQISSYLKRYPAPVAVAVALSSDASRYFSKLVLEHRDLMDFGSLVAFVSRLVIERPRFVEHELLGIAALELFAAIYDPMFSPSLRENALYFILGEAIVDTDIHPNFLEAMYDIIDGTIQSEQISRDSLKPLFESNSWPVSAIEPTVEALIKYSTEQERNEIAASQVVSTTIDLLELPGVRESIKMVDQSYQVSAGSDDLTLYHRDALSESGGGRLNEYIGVELPASIVIRSPSGNKSGVSIVAFEHIREALRDLDV